MMRLEVSFPSLINIAFIKVGGGGEKKILTQKLNHHFPVFAVFSYTQAVPKVTH